jgi:hypothetical protein
MNDSYLADDDYSGVQSVEDIQALLSEAQTPGPSKYNFQVGVSGGRGKKPTGGSCALAPAWAGRVRRRPVWRAVGGAFGCLTQGGCRQLRWIVKERVLLHRRALSQTSHLLAIRS